MAASPRPVTEIQIGGNAYRVQTSADAAELARLVEIVEARLAALPVSQRSGSRSLVLVALSLAHDLEQARREQAQLRDDVVARLTTLVTRVDTALDHRDENGDPLPPIPSAVPQVVPSEAPPDDADAPALVSPPLAPEAVAPPSRGDRAAASSPLAAPSANSRRAAVTRRARTAPGAREANDPS